MIEKLYDQVTKFIPKIGDYIIDSSFSVGVILGITLPSGYDNSFYYKVYYPNDNQIDAFYNIGQGYIEDVVTISPDLGKLLLTIDTETRYYLFRLVSSIHRYEQDLFREEIYFKYIEDYLNGIACHIVQKLVFHSGVKKILGKKQSSSVRIIEFNNGQVWETARKKHTTTSGRRNIRKYNTKHKDNHIKSVEYKLLKRIK